MLFGQFSNINVYVMIVEKNARPTNLCITILQSRGQDPKKSEIYGTNLSPKFNKNQDLVPWIGEEQCIKMLFWHVSNNPDICWKIAVSIISYIFDLPEIWLSVSSQIQLWNHIVFYYFGSQFSIPFGIKSTLITFCLCMKLIISHYRYEWCLILYTSYGCCFFEGHLRWFNSDLCVFVFTRLIIC